MTEQMTCPKCGGAMETGFVLDRTTAAGGAAMAEMWQDGPPEPSMWTGVKLHRDQQRAIVNYRCADCGFIESYAP